MSDIFSEINLYFFYICLDRIYIFIFKISKQFSKQKIWGSNINNLGISMLATVLGAVSQTPDTEQVYWYHRPNY